MKCPTDPASVTAHPAHGLHLASNVTTVTTRRPFPLQQKIAHDGWLELRTGSHNRLSSVSAVAPEILVD